MADPKADNRKRSMSFSSQNVTVQRWFGGEILDHSPTSVRMDFLKSGNAPLLMHHDMRQQVGVIEGADLKNGQGVAQPRFGRSVAASDAMQNVDDDIYRNTSVGYRVHAMRFESSDGDDDVYRVIDWEPYEVSLVGVPADPTVGVGRTAVLPDKPPDAGEAKTEPPEPRSERGSSFPEADKASPTGASPEPPASADKTGVITMTEPTGLGGRRRAEDHRRSRPRTSVAHGDSGPVRRPTRSMSRAERQWIEDAVPNWSTRPEWTARSLRAGVASQILDVSWSCRTSASQPTTLALGLSTRDTQKFSLFKRHPGAALWRSAAEAAGGSRVRARMLECRGQEAGRDLTSSILIPGEVLQRPLGEEAAQRAMATQPGAKGGYMVNVQNMGFIDILRNRSVAMAMGARVHRRDCRATSCFRARPARSR
jgi:hypothetical protein